MASGKTERRALPFPLKTDPDTLSSDIGLLAKALDNDAETLQVKKHSELPSATTRGRIAYVEEGTEKGLYWATGAAWVATNTLLSEQVITEYLAKESVTEAKVAKEAVTGPKLGAGTVRLETGDTQAFLAWAFISATGTIEASSGDFSTVVIAGTSIYKIKWKTARATAHYAVIATADTGGVANRIATVMSIGTETIEVGVFNASTAGEEAKAFGIVVLGLT